MTEMHDETVNSSHGQPVTGKTWNGHNE